MYFLYFFSLGGTCGLAAVPSLATDITSDDVASVSTIQSESIGNSSEQAPTTEPVEYDAKDIVEALETTEIYFSEGMVRSSSNSDSVIKQVAIAQQLVTNSKYNVGENTKFIVFDEPNLYRVFYQTRDSTGKAVAEITILADKESGDILNMYEGSYMGPPESPR